MSIGIQSKCLLRRLPWKGGNTRVDPCASERPVRHVNLENSDVHGSAFRDLLPFIAPIVLCYLDGVSTLVM